MGIEELVADLSNDPTSTMLNYKCAVEYEKINQTASAISFYLRAAEYDEKNAQGYGYLALIKAAKCLDKQGQRDANVKNTLLHAISLSPQFPAAYFVLSEYHERKGNWQECYTYATLGLSCLFTDSHGTPGIYPGRYALLFEKAVSAYWIGRKDESLDILTQLLSDPDVSEEYRQAVKYNLEKLGATTEPDSFELNRRVNEIRKALRLEVPIGITFERFGSKGDGGYVLADAGLTGTTHVYSFGVDKNIDFEKDLISKRNICHIETYDNSIDDLPEHSYGNRIAFTRATLGAKAEGHLTLEEVMEDEHVVEYENDDHTKVLFEFWGDGDFVLKMDVEGAEYDLINEAPTIVLNQFSQITMEVHWMDRLADEAFYKKALAAFTKLRETHVPVLVHPNNDRPLLIIGNCPVPVVFEVLYLNKKDFVFRTPDVLFEGLQEVNNPDVPDMGLSFP